MIPIYHFLVKFSLLYFVKPQGRIAERNVAFMQTGVASIESDSYSTWNFYPSFFNVYALLDRVTPLFQPDTWLNVPLSEHHNVKHLKPKSYLSISVYTVLWSGQIHEQTQRWIPEEKSKRESAETCCALLFAGAAFLWCSVQGKCFYLWWMQVNIPTPTRSIEV